MEAGSYLAGCGGCDVAQVSTCDGWARQGVCLLKERGRVFCWVLHYLNGVISNTKLSNKHHDNEVVPATVQLGQPSERAMAPHAVSVATALQLHSNGGASARALHLIQAACLLLTALAAAQGPHKGLPVSAGLAKAVAAAMDLM